ncbi:MAG: prolyl oligopeptidase family serine peptidase [Acidimicrobiales bacterium]
MKAGGRHLASDYGASMRGSLPIETERTDQVDNHHGEVVADPYRWLEDTWSPETAAWIAAQNQETERWLSQFPEREEIRSRLRQMFDYPRLDVPFERSGHWFQTRNTGLQDQHVLYAMEAPDDDGRVLLDPNKLSENGTVALSAMAVTDDGSMLAYATSSAGSDWLTWRVRDVETGEDRPDVVEWSKFSTAAWRRDGAGFYYGAAERPDPGSEYSAATRSPRVLFHRLGTDQLDDRLVFAAPNEPEWLPHATVTEDGRYCVITITRGTNPEARLLVIDVEDPVGAVQALLDDFSCKARVITNIGPIFYVLTDADAEHQRMVAIALSAPERERWKEIVPEDDALLLGARNCGGKLVCHYLENACSRLSVFELDGSPVRDIPLPPLSALQVDFDDSPVEGSPGSDLLHFGVWSFTDSGSLWSHDVATGKTRQLSRAAVPLEQDDFVTEQVFVPADDGVMLPMFLTRRRDLARRGDAPVLLYGYGGFDIPLTPGFNWARAVFVERGGVAAVANLRGGGEYGRAWHDAGRLARKQRVFDDFCDCARWLVSSGWTRPDRIAINGGSNGGLLVGACLTQRPELFGAAVPEVGVLDMLRYHLFTIGWAWKSDFGDPDDPEEYRWLRAYSPLHNLSVRSYPSTLVMTGDHDDRVLPGHSFKFAAALQQAQSRTDGGDGLVAPVLIRIETAAGHGRGKPVSKVIAERADMLTFIEAALGLLSH